MAALHELKCDTSRRNTGYGGCPVDWKLISGAFFYDSPVILNEAQLADLQNTLQTQAFQDSKDGRCYPVHNFLNPQDNTQDPTFETFADGSMAFVRDGVYDWTFQITEGGFCLLQALRTHNGNGTIYAFFYDKEKKILGYNNNGEFAAIPIMVFQALPWKMNTGSNTAKYLLRFVFATNYANEDADYVKAEFPLTNVKGLQDIKLKLNGFNHASGLVNVSVITECGGSNLFDRYSTQLVSALWLAANVATGGTISITGVTPQAGSKTFNVVLTVADPDYPVSNAISLQLAAPSVLTAANIPGYESEQALLTVVSS